MISLLRMMFATARSKNSELTFMLGKQRCSEDKYSDLIYLLTEIRLSPGGSSTVHVYTQTIHRATQQFWKSAGRALSWLVIPWHLPYNRGKSTEKPQSG